MTKRSQTMLWLAPALVVFAAGFALAALYDLAIDQALYSPQNPAAIIMEAVGWYPAFLSVFFLAMLLLKPDNKSLPMILRGVFAGVVVLVGTVLVFESSYEYFIERGFFRGFSGPGAWLWLLFGLAVFGALLALALKSNGPLRRKLVFFSVWASVFFLAQQAVINILKLVWQRTRFDDMLALGSFEAFTPWYLPFGGGGSSFPSGHTANAAGVFALILLCDLFPAFNKYRRWVYGFCWVYIAGMGLARIVIGRHFLSDTLAAAGLMAILFCLLRRSKPYTNGLRRARLAGKAIGQNGGALP